MPDFLLKYSFLEIETASTAILTTWVAESYDATCQSVRMVLSLHLQLLGLVVHVDGVERVLGNVRRLVPVYG